MGNYKIGILKMSKEEIEKIAKEKEAKLLAAKKGGGMMPILAVLFLKTALIWLIFCNITFYNHSEPEVGAT